MKLQVTEQAADQIAAIVAYLVERSPVAARNVQRTIDATLTRLTEFPGLGRRQRTAGVRKIGAGRYPYNIYYRVDEQAGEVVILSVRHTSRAPRFFDA
jgi:plasmid stabilization system protein ParE